MAYKEIYDRHTLESSKISEEILNGNIKLKPYYKNGKLNANKVAIDGIPFIIIFYVINKYVQAAVMSDGGDIIILNCDTMKI